MSTDQRTFRFQMNGRTANAHSVGSDHVALAFSAEGVAVSVVMPVAEAGAMAAALIQASDACLTLGMRPEVARVADDFDAQAEAERVRHACGDQAAPRLPAEDGR